MGGRVSHEVVSVSAAEELQSRLREKIRRELGAQICDLLSDPEVVEVMLNPDGVVWVDRLGGTMQPVGAMSAVQAESLMGTVAAVMRTTITRDNPVLECELPLDGSRLEALLPPIVSAPTFAIRRKAAKIFTLSDYVRAGIMTQNQRIAIERMVARRKNLLVAGGTSSGKTTLTNAILHAIAESTPDHRLVIIEDTAELQCPIDNHVMLRSSRSVDQLQLLKVTMRLRPDRICLGEVRGAEALTLLKAWNTGHPGGICTIHANSARASLTRLEQLVAESSSTAMGALIGEAVDGIISISKIAGDRRVQEVVSVLGYKDGDYLLESVGNGSSKESRPG